MPDRRALEQAVTIGWLTGLVGDLMVGREVRINVGRAHKKVVRAKVVGSSGDRLTVRLPDGSRVTRSVFETEGVVPL
jgi:hypothetical protein